jgi:hypothetical protein
VACLVAAVLWSPWGGDDNPNAVLSRACLGAAVGVATLVACAILYGFWNFDLDDKWIYYRVSENVTATGLPLWNRDELALVGASFVYPYVLAPGHAFGGPQEWDLYQKIVGAGFHFATAYVVARYFEFRSIGVVCAAAILIYTPSLLWSIGALETALTTLWIAIAVTKHMTKGSDSRLFWLMAGTLIFIRPDAILLGVGAFIGQFLRQPLSIRHHLIVGTLFSLPVLAYLAINQLLFGFPLPLVFLEPISKLLGGVDRL